MTNRVNVLAPPLQSWAHAGTAFTLHLQRSRCLLLFVSALHGMTLVIIGLIPLVGWQQLLLSTLVIANAGWLIWAQILLNRPRSIIAVTWTGAHWQLHRVNGDICPVQLLASSVVTVPVVLLQFRYQRWRQYTVTLCYDSLPIDELRRLRVWLTCYATFS